MYRRRIVPSFLVLALVVGGASLAEDVRWTNEHAGNSSWCEGANWDSEAVPDSGDTAWVDQITYSCPNRGPIVFTGCTAQAAVLQGPNPAYGNTQVIDVNGTGTVNVGQWSWIDGLGTGVINIGGTANVTVGGEQWRGPDDGVGIINISGEPEIFISGTLKGADGDGSFYVNMSGGHVECDDLVFGDNGGGGLNLSGGSLILGDDLDLGGQRGVAPITVNMTGGLMRIGGDFQLPSNANRAGVVVVNLHGGVIECGGFVHGSEIDEGPSYTDEWLLDVEAGTLKIQGDVKAAIDANVAAGQITAYGGEGIVVVEVLDGNTVVTAWPAGPNTATNPYPVNRSRQVDPNVVCHWTPGLSAASHDVYFGTDFNDVNDGTTSDVVYEDNIEANEWDPCGVGVALDELTTYYWRIDEVNGPQTWKGRTWHFTTSGPVIDPNMLLWYKFDEPNGFLATDSSGYGNDGMLNGLEELWDAADGHAGGSRIFDGETVVQVPSSVLADIGSGITFCVWLKDTYEHSDNLVFDTGVGGETGPYHVYANVVSDQGDVVFRAGNDTNDLLRAHVASREGWHHFAFVKDEAADGMWVYVDAELVKSKNGVKDTLVNISGAAFKIGAPTWGNYDYKGKVDDFKVFDRALSEKEVAGDYRGGDVALAWAPSPGDYAEDVPRDANLSWRPGNYVQDTNGHRVFIGTSWEDVNDKTAPSVVQDACEYDAGVMELDTTYYWRVEEINDTCVWTGPVWRFRVADFIIVDDFEGYDSEDPVQYTWYDQYSQEEGEVAGAWLELVRPPKPVHSGDQAVSYTYDTDDPWADLDYAEAWLPLEEIGGQQNWREAGVTLLRLFFYGDSANDTTDAEQMYVGVDDTDGAYAEMRYGDNAGEDMN
ncbi:MAG TPA: LamG domain-containing protein, partial [Sedimentisphaerales bacterium]|nr:LamG domain-containing protein [Sedimentisphaerales bacterium]